MDLAIITEKYGDGRVKVLRSTTAPTLELRAAAEKLDKDLAQRMARLEKALIREGQIDEAIPPIGSTKARGSVELWYAVGSELRSIVDAYDIRGARERRWLWEALSKLHATERINRVSRGRTRQHFEYCYRLAQFPLDIAHKMYWSEWVYFFDSLTVREEPRADRWLEQKLEGDRSIDRPSFRRFTETLNRRVKMTDTSVLSDQELVQLYDDVWTSATVAPATDGG
jgi:hypothetical protein